MLLERELCIKTLSTLSRSVADCLTNVVLDCPWAHFGLLNVLMKCPSPNHHSWRRNLSSRESLCLHCYHCSRTWSHGNQTHPYRIGKHQQFYLPQYTSINFECATLLELLAPRMVQIPVGFQATEGANNPCLISYDLRLLVRYPSRY